MSQGSSTLPLDVTPGMVAGLLEVISLLKGRVDLPLLSRELGMELGMLLRVIDVAELLGLVKVEDGDVLITSQGQNFSRRVSSGKIKMLRDRVAEVEPFRSIINFVGSRKEGVQVEEINAALNLCESGEEQLDRLRSFIIDWLVMTGWLGYNGADRVFHLRGRRMPRMDQQSAENP